MTFIQTSCPMCGDVNIPAHMVSVTENKVSPEWSKYSFICHLCQDEVTQPAGFQVLSLLAMTKGVMWNVVKIPAELDERHYAGPPLTEDDITDFVIELGLTPAHLISLMAEADK